MHVQKHTTIGVLNPAEGDGSIFVALAKAEQKGPGLFFLQQVPCSRPAHKSHDGPEAHTHTQYDQRLVNWEAQRLHSHPHSQVVILRRQSYCSSHVLLVRGPLSHD